ncbi:hypothetical protein [Sinosporangium siamense]|uniref:Uncharacterized protein n=1 Tax=Sinosporangium siamense TaxID=1367973 RepID=A0A919RBL8_9ACTN|nr:hypothetical protein [Sinosporangium siamense]GII90652.1 hypothetical protein Ssi02_08830 [Sinosporangium siamense]
MQIRDPRTTPPWHTITQAPADVTCVALSTMGNDVHVTVLTSGGGVAQSSCTVNPTPGTGSNPAWPGNCTAFVNLTPPLRAAAQRNMQNTAGR